MSRYIDADEFLENESEAYMRAQVSFAEEHADTPMKDLTRYVNEAVHKKIQMLINATESADVVEVVRCKDCIHNDQCKHRVVMWVEDPINTWHKDIDFCSYGERKEQEHE